jgi:hypothetical protein
MRQVLLVARRMNDRPASRPVLLWMDDNARVGDRYVWDGAHWVVSAVYGTHFSASAAVARRDRPYRHYDTGDGCGVCIDR